MEEKRMKIVNGRKFVSPGEIAACLNARITDERFRYGVPELACAWANTRKQYFLTTEKKVEEGVHYIPAGSGEHLLSEEACKLIEELANVDGHGIPLVTDGAGELFKD